LFVVPWEGRTLVGASWTPMSGSPEGVVEPTLDEVRSFTASVDARFPELGLAAERVRFATAGLYPVFEGDGTNAEYYAASRRPLVIDHGMESGLDGLVTAVSTKFTTARALAERLVDGFARQQLTRGVHTDICGTAVAGPLPAARTVADIGAEDPASGSDMATRFGETAARDEMALSLPDIVLRRSTAGLRGVAAGEVLHSVARGAGRVLNWNPDRIRQEVEHTEALYHRMGVFADGGEA
jgi:glycerol-3-phosphate dehydrogenase